MAHLKKINYAVYLLHSRTCFKAWATGQSMPFKGVIKVKDAVRPTNSLVKGVLVCQITSTKDRLLC